MFKQDGCVLFSVKSLQCFQPVDLATGVLHNGLFFVCVAGQHKQQLSLMNCFFVCKCGIAGVVVMIKMAAIISAQKIQHCFCCCKSGLGMQEGTTGSVFLSATLYNVNKRTLIKKAAPSLVNIQTWQTTLISKFQLPVESAVRLPLTWNTIPQSDDISSCMFTQAWVGADISHLISDRIADFVKNKLS